MNINLYFELALLFKKNGFSLYLVGGSVRDYLLKNTFFDMDLTTNAKMEDVKMFLPYKTIYKKYESGVFVYKNHEIDITTLREEKNYVDYRHPTEIKYVQTPFEDYLRRDFTINALYIDINGNIIDYVDGQKDLNNKLIKMIGNPLMRFEEDPLRIIRAIRFKENLNFQLDREILESIKKKKSLLKKINYQKISLELKKFNCSFEQVREIMNKYDIDKEVPLFFEYDERKRISFSDNFLTELYEKKSNIVKNNLSFDLNIMQKASGLLQVFRIVFDGNLTDLKQIIDYYHDSLKDNKEFIEEVYDYDDLIKIYNQGKRMSILEIEIGSFFSNTIDLIDRLFDLGIRMIVLNQKSVKNLYDENNIREFGIRVLNRINELGIILGLDNIEDFYLFDILNYISKPLYILNPTIEQLKKLNEHKNYFYALYNSDFLIKHFSEIKEIVSYKRIIIADSCCFLKNAKIKDMFTKKKLDYVCYLNFFELLRIQCGRLKKK